MADEPVAGRAVDKVGDVASDVVEQGAAAARVAVAGAGNVVEQALALIKAAKEILHSGAGMTVDIAGGVGDVLLKETSEFKDEVEASLTEALGGDTTEDAR